MSMMLRRQMMRQDRGKSDMTQWTSGVPYSDIDIIQNSYYSIAGNALSYNGWDRTGKIPCHGASNIVFNPFEGVDIDRRYCSFFGENGTTQIQQFDQNISTSGTTITVPDGAWFFGISAESARIAAMINSKFTPYE